MWKWHVHHLCIHLLFFVHTGQCCSIPSLIVRYLKANISQRTSFWSSNFFPFFLLCLIQFGGKWRPPFNKASLGYDRARSVNSPPSKATFSWLDTLKGGVLIEDGKVSRPRRRQTVDGHFLTPRGLAAFVCCSLLYKSLLFNLEVRPNVVSFNHISAGTPA